MDRKYFTIIPNIVDDMELSPLAFRLYAHIKRVAGEDGICWQNRDTLAHHCRISTGAVTNAKRELVDAGLITIVKQEKTGGMLDVISVVDIWSENMEKCKPCSPPDTPLSPCDTKKNSHEEEHKEPDSDESAPNGTTKIFHGWWDELKDDKANRPAVLMRMFKELYPEHDPPTYSRLGGMAKKVGAGQVASLLWQAVPLRPNGDVLAYVTGMNRKKGGNGRKSNFEQTWENLMGEELQQ